MAIAIQIGNRRYKATITITAGTPILLAQGATPILADRIMIQMVHGASGRGLVYDDVSVGATPAQIAAGADIPVELGPATATAPGGSYSDTGQIDLRNFAIDGTNTGDVVLVNAHLRI